MMKKIILSLFFILSCLPTYVLAEGIVPEGSRARIPNPLGNTGIQGLITNIFNIAYGVAGVVAVAYLIVGGYQYITSQGNPEATATAKSTIINSIIGLIVILASYLIIRFALAQLGAGGVLG
ncbi:MAG: pilin [Candidatus Berkelbacteria bacterium]|nr:pilin [Candidatus Berkelbacteria bacterium]